MNQKLKHKQKKPNYSIMQFINGQERSSASYHTETVDDEFRQIFLDALDHIISAIQDRCDQPKNVIKAWRIITAFFSRV